MDRKIAVIGLGYVGLPVAISFSKYQRVIAYDISSSRIDKLKKGIDHTNEITSSSLKKANILWTDNPQDLHHADFYIITVPTSIDKTYRPNLKKLKQASKTVAKFLKRNDIVVYESTVYPGATEEVCIPILETTSHLVLGKDFSVGYSPERISPGDKEHTFEKVIKVVSANSSEALDIIYNVYNQVISAGIYKAPSIKVAEAAKIIENTQRDLNIALMNELSMIFNRLNLDMQSVLETARTKWNFHPFTPGLVGGQCIGVNSYYLLHKAQMLGHHPEIILSGRKVNEAMGKYIATQTIKKVLRTKSYTPDSKIAILGVTFKEDCCDIRNSKVFDVIKEIKSYAIPVVVHDPIADSLSIQNEYDIALAKWEEIHDVQALIIAVGHRFYQEMSAQDFALKLKPGGIIIDVKGILKQADLEELGIASWRL